MKSTGSIRRFCALGLISGALLSTSLRGAPRLVGDVDNDGVITALDLARQIAYARGQLTLSEGEAAYADVNHDGVVNSYDTDALVHLILQTEQPAALPLDTVIETSPSAGESGVSLTREFVIHFGMPLALDAVVTTYNANTHTPGNLYAEFGGRKILSRAELSSDRKKATLFFLEPLPSSARVRVTFDPAGLKDMVGRNMDGDGDGIAGGAKTVDFDTLGISALTGTGVIGHVFGIDAGMNNAQSVRPLGGVTITVDGAEQTLRSTTAADGSFSLNPAPAGRFFVLVDGRTAGGSGGYYAFVGKAWEGIAGRLDTPVTPATANTAAGDIYLPFVPAGTLQTVSATEDTMITFAPSVLAANPALADVEITVPANSLFADNGARGGKVGIAPVAPERLPEPLPTGLSLPLVITIQTDGATNFDRPVPVRFPNLPDPVTGTKLAPGAKSALVSFNHDTGVWELGGSMTVTADGRFVETDRGVGVRQPGWHGAGPFGRLGGQGDPPCEDSTVGDNAASMAAFTSAKGKFDDKLLDSGKKGAEITAELLKTAGRPGTIANLVGDVAGAGLSVIDPILKTRDCINQSLDGAPNFFGSQSLFYMPRGCVDMAVEFALLPLEEAKLVGKEGLAILKIGKALVDLSDTLNDAQDIEADLERANALLERTVPCNPPAPGQPDPLQPAYQDFKNSLDDLARAAPDADRALTRLDQLQPTLDQLNSQINPSRNDLGFTHDQQALYAQTVREEAALWYAILGPDGYVARAARMIANWNAYSAVYLGRNSVAHVPGAPPPPNAPKRVIYMIEHDGIRQRVIKQNGGPFEVFLPGSALATVSAYEIDRKWIANAGPLLAPPAGQRATVPSLVFRAQSAGAPDTDHDGLTDAAERIVGSDPATADSNGDGVLDGAALLAGQDPSAGSPSLVGLIATLDTPGVAGDISARDNLVALADGVSGVVLYDASDRAGPRQLAEIALPGPATAVAIERPWLAVAVGGAGVSIVNIADPLAARIANTVAFGSASTSVAVSGGLALVGTGGGDVYTIDLATQQMINHVSLTGSIQDVVFGRDPVAYAMIAGQLQVLRVEEDGSLTQVRTVAAPGGVGAGGRRLRLFAALDRLYVTFTNGVNAFDVSIPDSPVLLRTNNFNSQFGWKQIVLATPTFGVAAVGNNSTNDGPHNIQLHDIAADGTVAASRALIETPGLAAATGILNGLAYVADGDSGLEVANYLATDTGTTAPTIALSASFTLTPQPQAEEGSRLLLTVDARDDVQVRNVELYLDGVLVQNDGNFPFEFGFTSPTKTGGRTSFTLQVIAYDTAGNSTASSVLNTGLVPDATPPRIVRALPMAGAISGNISATSAYFSEPVAPASVNAGSVVCRSAGNDRLFDTADDVVVTSLTLAIGTDGRLVTLSQATSLPPGRHRFEITTAVTDLAGNHLAAPFTRLFQVFSFADRDGDGVPDDLEAALGLDPDNPDTNGNGISDGLEDFDHDGLGNAFEVSIGTDPRLADTDGNGITDASEDTDLDGLTNKREFLLGTDATRADTDGDGWNDEAEVSGRGDPLNPAVGPALFVAGRPGVGAVLYSISASAGEIATGTVVGRPSVGAVLYSISATSSEIALGTVVGRPAVNTVLYSIAATNAEIALGTVVGRPVVGAVLYSIDATTGEIALGTTVGRPRVDVTLPSP